MRIAIVTIGYNRVEDFVRLINSLLQADYEHDKIDLIMSIDNSGTDCVERYACTVEWPYGERIIKTYKERQGLKKHILQCGNYLDEYDALVVLEDDVVVSRYFYHYVKKCVKKYENDNCVAGISLYTHLQNVYAKYPFTPAKGNYDVFFFQMAQSWGQVWMKKQWMDFVNWYKKNNGDFPRRKNIPSQLYDWGDNSWLKYHIRYCIECNKYFVYPYDSLSTCFASVGEHTVNQNSIYQAPILAEKKTDYNLPECGSSDAVYYDAFFERQNVSKKWFNIEDSDVEVDLYGTKSAMYGQKRYLLTINECNYCQLKSFALQMRPHELNIEYGIKGSYFKLYDTQFVDRLKDNISKKEEQRYCYYHKIGEHKLTLLKVALHSIAIAVRNRFFKK